MTLAKLVIKSVIAKFLDNSLYCAAKQDYHNDFVKIISLKRHKYVFALQKCLFYRVKVYIESEIGKNAAIALSINDLKGLLEAA